MKETVCRAFTFVNYHIPLRKNSLWKDPLRKKEEIRPQHVTLGFFDGLFTERIPLNYGNGDMKSLWFYTLKRTEESTGSFSYQNIFGFGENAWNDREDEAFWSKEEEGKNPLTFIVFIQMKDYMCGEKSIEGQCRKFCDALRAILGENGMYYVYATIDKNDFIVCIRSRRHSIALEAIKKLHETGEEVVYSYSTLSVNTEVLERLGNGGYQDMYEEKIDSICLKGITNGYSYENKVSLEHKYIEFCSDLMSKLEYECVVPESVVYDILGDEDFRLIARNVSLGKLLEQFGSNGCLSCYEGDFRFYLYSSSLVLNTKNIKSFEKLPDRERKAAIEQMEKELVPERCNALQDEMPKICEVIEQAQGQERNRDEKKITFCQAIWQLLQSLKVLEASPTKTYDFDVLYRPFSMLVRILEAKMDEKDLAENAGIFEYIHKISSILHGTLRNDIQFFQVRDFNAIGHYAPAKLRAFYGAWASRLSDFYNELSAEKHEYAFVLAPGLVGETKVTQLFPGSQEKERLMLITIPERHLYAPGLLCLILSHETSHFSGTSIRNREYRCDAWADSLARIVQLETCKYIYESLGEQWRRDVQSYIAETQQTGQQANIKDEIVRWFTAEGQQVRVNGAEKEAGDSEGQTDWHSEASKKRLEHSFAVMVESCGETLVEENMSRLKNRLIDRSREKKQREEERNAEIRNISVACSTQKKILVHYARDGLGKHVDELLGFMKYFYAESFADVMAVLTLNLRPEQYLKSFVLNEWHDIDLKEKSVPTIIVRIALVMRGINKAVENNSAWSRMFFEFAESWKGDWLNKLGREVLDRDGEKSQEFAMFCQIFAYQERMEKFGKTLSSLDKYNALYNMATGKFRRDFFDLLCDEVIVDDLLQYLAKCADTYIEVLAEKEGLRGEQKNILNSYHNLMRESPMSMAQEIEDFLYKK